MSICQLEEREAGRAYPRTCPTCRFGTCQKYGRTPLATLDALRAENERLQTIIGNLHDVEKQHRATINYQFSRAVLLQAENERLREALTQTRAERG